MREHTHLPAMVGFVSKHVAQHFHANRPRPSPAVSAKLLDAAPTTAERFSEHLRAASGALGQSRTGLLRRAVRAVELSWSLQVRSCKPDPLGADIVHVREDRRNGADLAFAGRFGCRRFGFPGGRVKMFDKNLVHAIVGEKDPGGKVLDCGSAELRVNLVLTRGHGRVPPFRVEYNSEGQKSMSLTSFVEISDVKERFRIDVTKPWFQLQAEIKAPPLTTSYGWTGTAFDYLMRFYLEKLNRSVRKRRWLAEESLAILESRGTKASTLSRVRRIVETARRYYLSYLRSKRQEKPAAELIRATVDLAQLDLVYRICLSELRPIKRALLEDVTSLLALVRPDDFMAKRTCVLNPTFGAASALVGGADADIFIDGTLIDIKTSKHLEMGRDVFNQLFGYYCLSCIGGINGCRGKVHAVAVYYARYRCSIGFQSIRFLTVAAFRYSSSGSRRGRVESIFVDTRSKYLYVHAPKSVVV